MHLHFFLRFRLMASFASSLSPIPSFPQYTGPYKVGTVDVELPVSGLDSPSPAPDGASEIHTVLFRIFYPAVPEPRSKRVPWLPAPQRLHIAAYAQFMGAGTTLASIVSCVSSCLGYSDALLTGHIASSLDTFTGLRFQLTKMPLSYSPLLTGLAQDGQPSSFLTALAVTAMPTATWPAH